MALRIDVWSDIACPWCWVGKRHLETALSNVGPDIEANVVWRAFELNPQAPASVSTELSYAQRLGRKYGVSDQEAAQMIDRMTGVGKDVGLEFRFDRIRPTNTFDAHRLVHWAHTVGSQEVLKERLFRAYMSEGALLSDREILVAQAAEVGLDADEARRVLSDGAYETEVRQDEGMAQQLMIQGVPFFVLGGRYAISGAQPASVLQDALRQVEREAANGSSDASAAEADDGPSCSIDGKSGSVC